MGDNVRDHLPNPIRQRTYSIVVRKRKEAEFSYIRCCCVQMGEFSLEKRITVVADLFECGRLDLLNNSNSIPLSEKSLLVS